MILWVHMNLEYEYGCKVYDLCDWTGHLVKNLRLAIWLCILFCAVNFGTETIVPLVHILWRCQLFDYNSLEY